MKNGILVCARTGSTRLPNKMMMEINGKTMIEYLIDRMKQSRHCNEIVFCTTQLEQDDVLADIAERAKVSCYRGSNEDKLDRWYKAALQFDIDYFVNVDEDDLFCEPELIDLAFGQQNNTHHDFVKCDESNLVLEFSLLVSRQTYWEPYGRQKPQQIQKDLGYLSTN
jgi:spore coat polysaccharide biosynthesis protein SpsF